MCKILVIAPYKGLKDLFDEVNKDLKKNIDTRVGNLYEGLSIAKSLEHNNYDAIISRGATARLLREHFSIPVLDVKVTGYDILRTFTLLHGHSGKVGMMSYLNTIQGANIIGQLLNMDLSLYEIHEEKEVEEKIEIAAKEGIQVIIGDVISTNTAAAFGLQGILITSGKEAVNEAIEEAEQLIFYMKQKSRELARLTAVLDQVEVGILIFDEEKHCFLSNKKVNEQLDSKDIQPSMVFEQVLEYLPIEQQSKLLNENNVSEIKTLYHGRQLIMSKVTLASSQGNTSFALLLRDHHFGSETQAKHSAYFHFSSLVMRSENSHKLFQSARKISHSELPILISGEEGVGKTSLAQAIHNESDRKGKAFIMIDCKNKSEQQLERELFGYEDEKIEQGLLERTDGGTLFIKQVDHLPFRLQSRILSMIDKKEITRQNGHTVIPLNVRIISSTVEGLDTKVMNGEFDSGLYQAIKIFSLKVPPLRERIDDIEDFIRLFIASNNMASGRVISGLRPELISALKELNWPGNIKQLKHIIEQMCNCSNGPFIELTEVEPILNELKGGDLKLGTDSTQIANKTLHQIEQEVINKILVEEDFNQSKAAQRLGINRTTLWRKIKDN